VSTDLEIEVRQQARYCQLPDCDLRLPAGHRGKYCDERCEREHFFILKHGRTVHCQNANCAKTFRTMGSRRICGRCEVPQRESVAKRHGCQAPGCRADAAQGEVEGFCSFGCFRRANPDAAPQFDVSDAGMKLGRFTTRVGVEDRAGGS
jgi:hypothetical protein